MNATWQAAWSAVVGHPLFALGITLLAYQLGVLVYERTRKVYLQPFLVAVLLLVIILLACGLPYEHYRTHNQPLTLLLGPSTVALAVPLFLNLARIRQLFRPILLTLLLAGTVTTLLGIGLSRLFGVPDSLLLTLAPKSVTSPIAMLVAEKIGGVAGLAAVFVLLTGVMGAILGPWLLTRAGVRHPAARGMALGLTSHAVGTAQALQEGEECGAFSALGMSLMGVTTAVLMPFVFIVLR